MGTGAGDDAEAGKTVGVLGGGISGLTFASLVPGSEVLEKEPVFGGLMRSVSADGYTFDCGSHIIFSRNKEALGFMLGLLGRNRLTHRRNTVIFYKGRRVKYPFENGLGALPPEEAMECAEGYRRAWLAREGGKAEKPENFREWMAYRFGRPITDKYLYPYNRKVWDYPPERMGCAWVEGRVPQPPLEDVMKAAKGEASEGYTHQLEFHYPAKGGIQALPDALAMRIGRERLVPGFGVRKIRKEGPEWVVEGPRNAERRYAKLVSTLHPLDFINAYEGAPAGVKEAARSLRWNSAHLVMLGLAKHNAGALHWAYIPDDGILPNRISFPSNMSPAMAPSGRSSVLAEVTFAPGGEKARMKDSEVAEQTVEGLHRIGVLDRKDVVFAKVATCRHAYVVYDLEHERNMRIVRGFAAAEGATLLGRWGEFEYYNSDRCIGSAMADARAFIDAENRRTFKN